MANNARSPDSTYKVGEVLQRRELLDLHDSLPDRWLGESGDASSLRELAREINLAVLATAMSDAGIDSLEGEVENAYRLLTDNDVSAGVRTQQRNRLERAGVDVDQLLDDFVTHQAVHTYLTKGLGVSKDTSDQTGSIETYEERFQRLRSRAMAVMENSLSALQDAGSISLGTFDTIVVFRVYCQDCETQFELGDLLRRGGCHCEQ